MLLNNCGIIFLLLNIIKISLCSTLEPKKSHNFTRWEPKIIGGLKASIESYPFAVQFFNKGGMCGGVIYNSWTVVTSAHCFATNTDTDEMTIQAGSRYLYDFNSDKYKVKSIVIHEDYSKEKMFACDIGLIFLEQQLILGKSAKKAIVVAHDNWTNEGESEFTIAGWGWTKYDGEVSNSLMMTRLHYVPAAECNRLHNNYGLTADMFCLYGEGKRDTCKGDSGGGVLWRDVVVGLTSHGDGCAKQDRPSIYTNLRFFRHWIQMHVNKFIRQHCAYNVKGGQKHTS